MPSNRPSLRQLTHTPTERKLQDQIVEGLAYAGYIVRQLGHITKQIRCTQCGHWQTPHVGYGNDPGVPDLLVSHTEWPRSLWSGIELKNPAYHTLLGTIPAGVPSKEQAELVAQDRIALCRSLEEVLAVLESPALLRVRKAR